MRLFHLAPEIGVIEVSTPWGAFERVSDKEYHYQPKSTSFTLTPDPAKLRRIVIIGDSLAYGFSAGKRLPPGKAFPELVLSLLGVNTQVFNLAVPGFNTSQEVAYFRDRGLPLRATDVVLQFCMNDFCDASAESRKLAKVEWAQTILAQWGLGPLLEHSQLFRLVVLRVLISWARWREVEQGQQFAWCLGRKDTQSVAAAFSSLEDLARREGLRVWLLPVPTFRDFLSEEQRSDWAWLKTQARMHQFRFIDVFEAFRKVIEAGRRLDSGDSLHLNGEGHKIVAEILASALKEVNLSN